MARGIAEAFLGPAGDMARFRRLVGRGGVVPWLGLLAIVVALGQRLAGTEETVIPAAVGLVLIFAMGMLGIDHGRGSVMGALGLALFPIPFFWGLVPGEAVLLGSIMAVSFAITATALDTLRNESAALDQRLQTLFERSPMAMLEEDWTDAVAYVRSEYTGRPERIRSFLLAFPEVVKRAMARVSVEKANRAAVELLEAAGPHDLMGPLDPGSLTEAAQQHYVDVLVALYGDMQSFAGDYPARTLSGRRIWLQARWVDTSITPGTHRLLVALADVTHLKAKQEALAEVIRSKDAFIASISHELRTPLTAVVGLTSELGLMEEISDEERAEFLDLVSKQAQEMSNIVEDLLVAARSEMGSVQVNREEVDLMSELEKAIEGVGLRLVEVPGKLPRVMADAVRVRQILRNLLTNLGRYGGPTRRILGGLDLDVVWLEVRDDGEGVSSEDADRIFQPYATAHRGVVGSVGLGLSVARQLAELMGGSLHYYRDGDESVFRLELPVAEHLVPL